MCICCVFFISKRYSNFIYCFLSKNFIGRNYLLFYIYICKTMSYYGKNYTLFYICKYTKIFQYFNWYFCLKILVLEHVLFINLCFFAIFTILNNVTYTNIMLIFLVFTIQFFKRKNG
ncbi:hypothetical protein EDEG_02506 [Edhazardia aedis USNM 41457]|uniref:Uncharacterized protein n=1 Tax=Edhazardia aedis (strain USNM 41457) TaxID=1003232 RepID=J9DKK8_EDHAE|nr:hypothetical protein EDEG_02506 [Edhazardia aedis USNM 41457]|eukprot:EJW03120.1 hypothetical protein EDEG_02506 [Edhazardia aedis USNM 41457]